MYPIISMLETWGTVGTCLITVIFLWDIFQRHCPPQLRDYLGKWTVRLSGFLNPYMRISIHEYLSGHLVNRHEAYAIVEAYLSVNSSKGAKGLKAEMVKDNGNKLMLSMDENEKMTDEFNGVKVTWISGKSPQAQPAGYTNPDKRYYRLEFHKRYKEMIIGSYLEHVIKTGKEIKQSNRQRKLYMNCHGGSYWSHTEFEHPASFDNLAMELVERQKIIDDLHAFAESKDYYARIGKAWKRGYLLYGPPGTGKTTMIAAMANLLEYDIYDLELTSVKDNTELKKLLIATTSKSIIVIEDIDCSLDLSGQRMKKEKTEVDEGGKKHKKESKEESGGSKVTLSGLLNSIDGLWSACAEERLIVFTTNYKHKLDPALIRRGRMDERIELSYCKYEGFKVLARNYLEIEEHLLFKRVEELIGEVEITPADVAEHLMPKSSKEGQEKCLLKLIQTLEKAKSGNTQKTKGDQQGTELGS